MQQRERNARRVRVGTIAMLGAVLIGCGGAPAPKTVPELEPSQKLRMAQSMMGAGRVGEALEHVDGAIRDEPGNASFHLFRGQLCFQSAQFAEAERSLRRSLELDPYITDAWIYLGAVHQELGQMSDAEQSYRSALGNPTYPTPEKAYHGLGVLYAGQGRDREAVESLRRAVEINPKFCQAHFELASILERTGRLREAVGEYEVASPCFTNSGEFHFRLGLAYFRVDEPEKARLHLGRVIDVSPGSENASRAAELLEVLEQ